MNELKKQTCPFCVELIGVDAKLCPRCRQWLTMKSFRHPVVGMIAMSVPLMTLLVVGALALFARLERLQNPKPYYSEFPDSLRVLESDMNWTVVRDDLRIYIAGVLTNTGPVAWQ